MATNYLFNKYGEKNIFSPVVLTAAPLCAWPPADHQEASVKQTTPIQLCEILQALKNEHGVLPSALVVGDKLMLDFLPSHSHLHSVGVKIKRAITGFGFSIERLSGAAITADATTRIVTDPDTGVCTGATTATTATPTTADQPTGLGATAFSKTFWINRATGLVSVPDVLVLTITALPEGGIVSSGTACCNDPVLPKISFTVNVDNGQHLG